MDMTPPLTRSPASPPNSYCPSERSSLDYPSPELVAQQYKISSIYGPESGCLDQDTPLPSLETMSQADWNHHSSPGVLPISSATGMPSILSAEYDSFSQSYHQSPLQNSYSHQDVYAHHASSHASHETSPSVPSRSPVSVPAMPSRTPISAHYPSPRSSHAPSDASHYTPSSSAYLSDAQQAAWVHPMEPEQAYYAATPGMIHDARSFKIQRPRRAPRRLTTKEEANFQCEVKGCGKLFSRSYNFKAHMETHDENREYPFPCQVNDCTKKFVRKTDLQRHHQSVHMKERNHRCDYCSRMFARKDTLRRHMDDGCSKRFDIGTMDLRAEGYDSLMGPRSMTMPNMGLPPLAVSSIAGPGLLTNMPPPLRTASHDLSHHGWGR